MEQELLAPFDIQDQHRFRQSPDDFSAQVPIPFLTIPTISFGFYDLAFSKDLNISWPCQAPGQRPWLYYRNWQSCIPCVIHVHLMELHCHLITWIVPYITRCSQGTSPAPFCFHNPNELRTLQPSFSTLSSADSVPPIKTTLYPPVNFLLNNELIPFFPQEGINSDSQLRCSRLLENDTVRRVLGKEGQQHLQKVLYSKVWLFPHKIHMDSTIINTVFFVCLL